MSGSPVVLGLDFGGTKIAAAVCDLAGRRIGRTVVDADAEAGAVKAFDRAITAARDLLLACAPDSPLAVVSAATFGIPFEDRVELAPTIAGWESLAFGQELRAAFPGAHVCMATDVKAAALAEARWGALAGCDPAIYVNLGTGLAAAIIVGGTVIRGAHGAAGEIGYNLRTMADVGKPLAERTMLEDLVSGKGLATLASTTFQEQLTAAEVFARAETDPAAAALIDSFATELAQHIVNLAVAIDPVRIAVGGGMTRSWDRLAPTVRRALDVAVPYPLELVLAEFPFEAPLIGALALGVEAAAADLGAEVLA
jgi:glucokinase